MKLSHFSTEETITPYAETQTDRTDTFMKPYGLWVSVDGPDDWAEWCADEMPHWIEGKRRHQVVLADDAEVLTLSTVGEILAFHETYAEPDPLFAKHYDRRDMRGINWARVAVTFQGIVIAPYQWSLRLGGPTQWYYPWDCASGCIWDPAAIKEVTLCG